MKINKKMIFTYKLYELTYKIDQYYNSIQNINLIC